MRTTLSAVWLPRHLQRSAPGFLVRDHITTICGVEAARDLREEVKAVHGVLDRRIVRQVLNGVAE